MKNAPAPPNLEESLVSATFAPSTRPFFYKNMLESFVFVPVSPNSNSIVFSFGKKSGKPSLNVYTSEDGTSQKTAKIKMRNLLTSTRGHTICLNPGLPVSKDFLTEEVDAILSGTLTEPLVNEQPLQPLKLGSVRKFQLPLLELLAELYKDHPLVLRASANSFQSERGVGVYVSILCNSTSAWTTAAQDTSILLLSADSPPKDFEVVRVPSLKEEICFYLNTVEKK